MEALHTLLVGQRAAYGADTADMYLRLLHCVSFQAVCVVIPKQLYKMIWGPPLLSLRWRSLAAGPSPYCSMTSRLRCVQLINRPTAPSPTLRWPSLMQCTSTWENPRPSSSVPQVRQRGSPTTKEKTLILQKMFNDSVPLNTACLLVLSRLLCFILHSHCVPVLLPAHRGGEAAAWDRHTVDRWGCTEPESHLTCAHVF